MNFMLFFAFALWPAATSAQSLLDATESFFDPSKANVTGIEVELAGLTVKEVTDTSLHSLGGQVIGHTRIESHLNKTTGALEHFRVKDKELINSAIGNMVIKPEDNSTDSSNLKENFANTQIVEIVTAPIQYSRIPIFQKAVSALKAAGALGTAQGFPISIQVNVEWGEGNPDKIFVKDLLNLLRNYLKPEHRELLGKEFGVPSFRQKYLGYYSPGMMAKIFDRGYEPDWKTFYFDFMYRQALEVLGYENAWTMEERWARKLLQVELKEKGFEVLLPVVKWNFLRISSLLMFMNPEDPLTKFLIGTTWFHPYPIVEFREPNNDFQVERTTRRVLGFVRASQELGEFEFVVGKNKSYVQPLRSVRGCAGLLKPAS